LVREKGQINILFEEIITLSCISAIHKLNHGGFRREGGEKFFLGIKEDVAKLSRSKEDSHGAESDWKRAIN